MLLFKLNQIHVPSLGRYLLPLPKLSQRRLALLWANLEGRGFDVGQEASPGRRVARKGNQRISIDGALGVATSGEDMLDALAPAIPALLASSGSRRADSSANVAAFYFTLKRSGASAELQLFPRMESLRTWTCLRKDGLCGLTPDEAAVLRHVLGMATASSQVECVTAKPRQGSKAFQVGRNLYYRSSLPVGEFLSSLRLVESSGTDSTACSYLPRDSVISIRGMRVERRVSAEELGEWCRLG